MTDMVSQGLRLKSPSREQITDGGRLTRAYGVLPVALSSKARVLLKIKIKHTRTRIKREHNIPRHKARTHLHTNKI